MHSSTKGKFVVIEGTDGSGKTEQFKRLTARLRKSGYSVATYDFPQYGKPSCYFVEEYLNGKYGGWKEVGPYKASLFYALDRFDIGGKIRRALDEGKVVVSNRYVASNMGHQGAKIADRRERLAFFKWLYQIEYVILGIPKPDLALILNVPARTAQKLVARKGKREYIRGRKKMDIHAGDIKHLERAEKAYLDMARTFPRDFRLIECAGNSGLLSIDAVHEKVWRTVKRII